METYSPSLEASVRKMLREASPESFAQLLGYYRRRGGPGLRLAAAEAVVRGLNPEANTFPPACPVCGQPRNRCICPPWLQTQSQLSTADVATPSNA